MKNYFTKFIKTSTLFSLLGSVTIIVGVPLMFYMAGLGGGAGLGAFIILGWLLLVLILIFFDRILVRNIKPLVLSVIELVLGGIFFVAYHYHKREVIVDLTDYKAEYFVLFYSNKGLTEGNIERGFLFDKKVKPHGNSVFISPQVKNKYRVKLNYPSRWSNNEIGIGFHKIYFQNLEELEFISIIPLTDAQEDSLIEKEISSAANKSFTSGGYNR